jgi:predicted ester cyclase
LAVERVSPPEKREEGGDKHMSAEDNKAVVRREVEELYNHTGNLDVADEIFSPDYVSYEPTSGETRGIEGARQFAATFREAFPDLQCTIDDMVAEGDKVVMRFRGSGTHQGETEAFGPATGKRMEMTGITIKRLSEGKIVEAWTNFDALGTMQQLGLIPEAATQA